MTAVSCPTNIALEDNIATLLHMDALGHGVDAELAPAEAQQGGDEHKQTLHVVLLVWWEMLLRHRHSPHVEGLSTGSIMPVVTSQYIKKTL